MKKLYKYANNVEKLINYIEEDNARVAWNLAFQNAFDKIKQDVINAFKQCYNYDIQSFEKKLNKAHIDSTNIEYMNEFDIFCKCYDPTGENLYKICEIIYSKAINKIFEEEWYIDWEKLPKAIGLSSEEIESILKSEKFKKYAIYDLFDNDDSAEFKLVNIIGEFLKNEVLKINQDFSRGIENTIDNEFDKRPNKRINRILKRMYKDARKIE